MNRVRRSLVCALALASVALLSPFRALAHAHPQLAKPAANSTVAAPSVISVTFTEPLEGKFSSLKLTDDHGKQLNTAASVQSSSDPKTLTLAVPTLPPGSYMVQWISVAADGHRMTGEYKFTVK